MRDLSAQTGIDNTDPQFLNGKIVDNQTQVGEGINQDLVQFLQKLMNIAGLSPNGNADNEIAGYQSISALYAAVNKVAKVLSDGENYTVQENIRIVIVPFFTNSGTINLAGYPHGDFTVISTGGSGVSVIESPGAGTIGVIEDRTESYFYKNGSNFTSVKKLYYKATTSQAIDGTADNVVMTPEKTESHYQALAASAAETIAAAIDDKHVTPFGLGGFYVDKTADDTETKALTISNKHVTPAGLGAVCGNVVQSFDEEIISTGVGIEYNVRVLRLSPETYAITIHYDGLISAAPPAVVHTLVNVISPDYRPAFLVRKNDVVDDIIAVINADGTIVFTYNKITLPENTITFICRTTF